MSLSRVYNPYLGRYVLEQAPLAIYTFYVTDALTGLPIQGAQCAITDRESLIEAREGAGAITNEQGIAEVNVTFPPNYYSVYRVGYETVRGTVPGAQINVALTPTTISYWVSVNAGVGGSVNPAGTFQVEANYKLTVTATPFSGHILDHWLVNGKKTASVNPLSVFIDRDSFSINAVFKTAEVPPPPPDGDSTWPVTRRIHLFDNYKIKNEWWEVAKTETREITGVDMDALIGGKLEYTIHYTRGNEIELEARLFWNDAQMARAILGWGKLKTDTRDLTGTIRNSNALRLWMETTPVTWAECSFDVWITLGYSKEPAIEPGAPELQWWEEIEPWQWGLAGLFGLGVVYIAVAKPKFPQIVTVPYPVLDRGEGK